MSSPINRVLANQSSHVKTSDYEDIHGDGVGPACHPLRVETQAQTHTVHAQDLPVCNTSNHWWSDGSQTKQLPELESDVKFLFCEAKLTKLK